MSANETTDQSPSSSSEDETVAEIRRFFKKHEIVKKLPKHMKELFIVETSADRNINISETFKEQFENSCYKWFPEIVDSPKFLIFRTWRFSEIVDLQKHVLK